METKNKGNAIGISLILVVFILLCLITFGTLSYLQAKADNELSISAAENTLTYYQAECLAQATLAEIDATLARAYVQVDSIDAYAIVLQAEYAINNDIRIARSSDTILLTFTTPVNEQEYILASLDITYPSADGYYTITGWTLQTVVTE